MGPEQRRNQAADVRRAADESLRNLVEGSEEAGVAGSGAGDLARAAGARRSDARSRRRGPQVIVRRSDRRSGRPRDDHLHHHARSRRRGNVRRQSGDDGARKTRARRRRRRSQVAIPPHSLRRAAGGDRHGRTAADGDAELGRRRGGPRQQLRRPGLRADAQRQQHRRGGSGSDVTRRDLHCHNRGKVMRNALTIAAREFEEKRFIAYAAVAFAILPFILGMIPGINGRSPQETIALSSLIFATGFGVALAVMTGASFVGRDLSHGRMSFYFSRPVASASIWFGKLTAGILMIVGCFAVIIAPAWLVTGREWKSYLNITLGEGSAIVLTVALALFLIAHVIGTFARSHSPIVGADFAAAVITGVAIRFLVLPLAGGQAFILIKWFVLALRTSLALAVPARGPGEP